MFGPLKCVALSLVCLAMMSVASVAQSSFSPALKVGDSVITRYQLDQRTRFLSLLGAPGDPRQLAQEQLINEAVQLTTAERFEIEIGPEELQAGMEEFAGRANLTAEQFMAALAQNGVESETFRDFVQAGLAWRNYSRARFRDEVQEIPRDQITRTLARTGTEGGLRVLVSEILLPATSPETTRVSRERAAQLSQITDASAFATAARQFSVAPSRARGGELNWTALDSLPDEVQGVIAALTPGQATGPVSLENAIGVFFLRNVERASGGSPESLSVDYALFRVEGSASDATAVMAQVDTCDDFYGIAQGLTEDRLVREIKEASAIEVSVRRAIEALDINETALVQSNGRPAVVMLCARQAGLESGVDFDLVANRLFNERLTVMAADHLANLRANTFIEIIAN